MPTLSELLAQPSEDPALIRARRIELNILRFQRMDPISLKIDRKLSDVTETQYQECVEYLKSGLDRIKTERKFIQDILNDVASSDIVVPDFVAAATEEGK